MHSDYLYIDTPGLFRLKVTENPALWLNPEGSSLMRTTEQPKVLAPDSPDTGPQG